jgi:hypothetical protein
MFRAPRPFEATEDENPSSWNTLLLLVELRAACFSLLPSLVALLLLLPGESERACCTVLSFRPPNVRKQMEWHFFVSYSSELLIRL